MRWEGGSGEGGGLGAGFANKFVWRVGEQGRKREIGQLNEPRSSFSRFSLRSSSKPNIARWTRSFSASISLFLYLFSRSAASLAVRSL